MIELETATGARHVQLGEVQPPARKRTQVQRRVRLVWLVALALLVAIVGAAGVTMLLRSTPEGTAQRSDSGVITNAPAGALPALPPPNLLKPLAPDEAVAINAERPIVARPDDPAAKFRLSGDAVSKLRAIDCLTQAIYYEAASEGVDGGRAVAQVVLNRMHHPGFPNSVCGVVYQGSDRLTGCQFTFTCDGSLARVPAGYLWARSRLIATEALAGRVFAGVGHATHYHADYVVPYWADSLDKVAVIGRHIFYRLRGTNGGRSAFSQRYAAAEPAPPLPPSTELIEQGLDTLAPTPVDPTAPPVAKVEEDRLKTLEPAQKATPSNNLPLQADVSRGQLILGDPAPPQGAAKKPKNTAQADCGSSGPVRVKALTAEDLKANATRSGC